MQDRQLYARILGIEKPWRVTDVELRPDTGEVLVAVGFEPELRLRCPECDAVCPGYDRRRRRWRHLDTCQYRTVLEAEIPRVQCPEHGVRQVAVPWAEPGGRFTALFEALVIDWLKVASFKAVAAQLGLSWDEVDGIQGRAVRRGLARRELKPPTQIGVDETSFQKRHKYVTVVNDGEHVVYVGDDRKSETLDAFYGELGQEGCAKIETVAMDMSSAYITSTERHVPNAESKIVFDKFHIAKNLGDAVDKVRRQENRELLSYGDDRLVKTKYLWLQNPDNMSHRRWRGFESLRSSSLQVARAWAIKEAAMHLWGYTKRGWATRMWKRWYGWAIRSRLEPIKEVARMIKGHWEGVINAATTTVTNALAEGMNRKIQSIKRMACGYRNRERFRNAIYFHLGGLDLYPQAINSPT